MRVQLSKEVLNDQKFFRALGNVPMCGSPSSGSTS